MPAKRFPAAKAAAIDAIKYMYIRAGTDHRFIPIWVVVVDGRVLVRPWNDKPDGWYREMRRVRRGAIKINGRTVLVAARPVRSAGLIQRMDEGYATKYPSKGNRKFVRGFATARRRATTMELLPA